MKTPKPYYEDIKTMKKLDGMSIEERIVWHAHRVERSAKVYDVLDRVMMTTISLSKLQQLVKESQERSEMIRSCIALHERLDFRQTREMQDDLRGRIMELANRRVTMLQSNPVPVSRVREIIVSEDALFDTLTQIELKLEQMCVEAGVNPAPFFTVGKLLQTTRGIATRQFCKTHLGYTT